MQLVSISSFGRFVTKLVSSLSCQVFETSLRDIKDASIQSTADETFDILSLHQDLYKLLNLGDLLSSLSAFSLN